VLCCRIGAFLLAVGLLTGPSPPLVADDAPGDQPPGSATLIGEVVTSGEFVDAAQAIEAAAKEDGAKLAAQFDFDALADIILQGLEIPDEYRKTYKTGFNSQGGASRMPLQIAATVKAGGDFTLLRVHRHGDKYAAVFRLKTNGGLNYQDLKLAKNADGKIKIHDFYSLLTGELASTSVRHVVLPTIVHELGTPLDKLSPKEAESVTHFPKYEAAIKAFQARNFTRVTEICESMPKSMQEAKAILILRYNVAARSLKWDEARAVTDDFRRTYPGDNALDLLALPNLLQDEKSDEALAAIDRIDKFIGGDPYLDQLRTGARPRKP
jgi:hypothetical protein